MRRTIDPLGIEIDIDLYEILSEHRYVAMPSDVEPILEWIEQDFVRLSVTSPYHFFHEDYFSFFENEEVLNAMSGGPNHSRLCALAYLYVEKVLKKKISSISGTSSCSYAGGWADLCAREDSFYVECGGLDPKKPVRALLNQQTILILPYCTGGDLVNAELEELVHPFFKNEDRLAKLSYISLAFLFEPLPSFTKEIIHPILFKRKRENMSDSTKSPRGFAAMSPEKQREIASKGGRSAHDKGTAHRFTSNEAIEAGKKGGRKVASDKAHMAEIGRKGGQARGARALRARIEASPSRPMTEDERQLRTERLAETRADGGISNESLLSQKPR